LPCSVTISVHFSPSSFSPGEVSQHLERITVAVLSQELLTKSALEMALLPILQGTWEEDREPLGPLGV